MPSLERWVRNERLNTLLIYFFIFDQFICHGIIKRVDCYLSLFDVVRIAVQKKSGKQELDIIVERERDDER